MQPLHDRSLRSHPDLALVAVADLPAGRRRAAEASLGAHVCALLRDRRSGTWQSGVDHDTAVLLHALATPRPARTVLAGESPERRCRILARLVCDRLLQVEGDDGRFADGIAARAVLFGGPGVDRLSSRLDRLSLAALDHAVAVGLRSSAALARRLYTFNTIPFTQRWHEQLADVRCWLGLDRQSGYGEQRSGTGDAPWRQWTRHGIPPEADLRHKIYVSPRPARLPEVLKAVAGACRALGVPAFKVGATPFGVLRPDKLVVYPGSRTALRRVADALGRALGGVEAQGVPFTAPIGGAGLLSWAVDPGVSWRTVVAEGLAASIARSQGQAPHEEIIEFALQRLRLDGIDPAGWRACGEEG